MGAFQRKQRRWVIDLRVRLALVVVLMGANLLGSAGVFVFATWVIPEGPLEDPEFVRGTNMLLFAVYLIVALPVGTFVGARRFQLWQHGTDEEQRRRERRFVLYGPLRLVIVQSVLWFVAAVLFTSFNLAYSPRLALRIGETILLGGVVTCALTYLLAERVLRRTAERVLRDVPMRRRRLPGIVARSLVFWALGSAVPVFGLILAGVAVFLFDDMTTTQLAIVLIAVGAVAIGGGFLVTVGATRAVADPVNGVIRAMAQVEEGDLTVTVPVYDGTEVGQLQSGFNTMMSGLRERERIRDLFGRHVGHEVAAAAAAAGEVRLGGERRQVAVLFVDIVGSTGLAASREPEEVVQVLNRFFAVVVGTVEEHGGWINKFEGDAALAVFGAPAPLADPAGSALAAARNLAARLAERVPEVGLGIGVSAGEVVAGNVGDVRRYEYTVIGDPVNEAARLTDVAKTTDGRVVAAAAAVELASATEARRWELGDAVTLRGRTQPTRMATPVIPASRPRAPRRAVTERSA
ncbi:adenylate/guanylate cyclase domain-containing protein [Pseudonocardia sp. CA-107938]|uniref:adenylate/guanylate cyclase domain-containing protein n=1 Tax=Pseudonocardia sp. CA-107938 TaxID=3240021 RepID=UPI003D8DF304